MNIHIIRFFEYLRKTSHNLSKASIRKPYLEPLLRIFQQPKLWSFRPREAAGGIALGIFLAFTPLMGAHMILGIIAASLFKVNLPLLLLCVWISNPITYPFLLFFYYYMGCFLLGMEVQYRINGEMFAVLLGISKPLWVGSLFIASLLSLLSYYVTLIFVSIERKLRHKIILLKRGNKKIFNPNGIASSISNNTADLNRQSELIRPDAQ